MVIEEKAKIFNIQRFSLDDGKGIRTNVFVKGCPLRCKWCHNIESQSFESEIGYFKSKCIGCNECVKMCKKGAVDDLKNINRVVCDGCGECADVCCSNALVVTGKEMTVSQVMDVVMRDKPFYGKNGGVTLTGGEPMSSFDFTFALAKRAREENISVNIETSGYGRKEDFTKIAPFCDCFLFDCKANDEVHKEVIGVDSKIILRNLDVLCCIGANVVLRVPAIPRGNLDKTFVEKIVYLAKKYDSIKEVHILPYHNTGIYKAEAYGKHEQSLFEVPDKSMLVQVRKYIEDNVGKKTVVL